MDRAHSHSSVVSAKLDLNWNLKPQFNNGSQIISINIYYVVHSYVTLIPSIVV